VIGLGVMEWADRYSKHGPNNAAQMTYLGAMAETARWLLDRGYNIRLLIGDFADVRAKEAFLQLLAIDPTLYYCHRIIDEPIHSIDDLLSQIAATDAVVATRFHNLLLAILCEKPVISISFHHKCDSLMDGMGMSEYCFNSADLKSSRVIEAFCLLEENADALKALIRERIQTFRDALEEQYQLILNGMQTNVTAVKSGPAARGRFTTLLVEPTDTLEGVTTDTLERVTKQ